MCPPSPFQGEELIPVSTSSGRGVKFCPLSSPQAESYLSPGAALHHPTSFLKRLYTLKSTIWLVSSTTLKEDGLGLNVVAQNLASLGERLLFHEPKQGNADNHTKQGNHAKSCANRRPIAEHADQPGTKHPAES